MEVCTRTGVHVPRVVYLAMPGSEHDDWPKAWARSLEPGLILVLNLGPILVLNLVQSWILNLVNLDPESGQPGSLESWNI